MNDPALFFLVFGVPLILVWLTVLIDLFRRSDLRVGKKLVWGVVALALSEIGALFYLLARPMNYPDAGSDRENQRASGFVTAAEGHMRGTVSDHEMSVIKRKVLDGLEVGG